MIQSESPDKVPGIVLSGQELGLDRSGNRGFLATMDTVGRAITPLHEKLEWFHNGFVVDLLRACYAFSDSRGPPWEFVPYIIIPLPYARVETWQNLVCVSRAGALPFTKIIFIIT